MADPRIAADKAANKPTRIGGHTIGLPERFRKKDKASPAGPSRFNVGGSYNRAASTEVRERETFIRGQKRSNERSVIQGALDATKGGRYVYPVGSAKRESLRKQLRKLGSRRTSRSGSRR